MQCHWLCQLCVVKLKCSHSAGCSARETYVSDAISFCIESGPLQDCTKLHNMSPLLLIVNRSIAHSEASRQSNAGNLTPAVRISGPIRLYKVT